MASSSRVAAFSRTRRSSSAACQVCRSTTGGRALAVCSVTVPPGLGWICSDGVDRETAAEIIALGSRSSTFVRVDWPARLRAAGIRATAWLAHAHAMTMTNELISDPRALVGQPPATIAGWKAVADGLLSCPCCAFHRNAEISSRYAWIYGLQPDCFKWAAMAAIASHHIRLALFPLRLDTDRTGYVDIPHVLRRNKLLLTKDVNTIRETNNAIFDDIFWVHLAYVTAPDGIEHLRALLHADGHYAPILAGFEAIDQGRRVLERSLADAEARRTAAELIWAGNVQLLEHEQRALVQPNFDHLSCAFARLVSMGSATSFEVTGARQAASYFTSFYIYSLTRGVPNAVRARAWPRITRFDDRWRWLVGERRSLLPELRFRHAPGRRQPATRARRSAQGRVDALRRTALTTARGSAAIPP